MEPLVPPAAPSLNAAEPPATPVDQPAAPVDQPDPATAPRTLMQDCLHAARDLVPRLSALALTLYVNSDPILFTGGLGIHGRK